MVVLVIGGVVAVRWFVRTANGAKAYHREPLGQSMRDYRGLETTTVASPTRPTAIASAHSIRLAPGLL